jgi:hypothetical protein
VTRCCSLRSGLRSRGDGPAPGVMTKAGARLAPSTWEQGFVVLSSGPGRVLDRATCSRLPRAGRVVRKALPVLNTISEAEDRTQRLFHGNV